MSAKSNDIRKPTSGMLDRRYFIGGSDARIIMGDDEAALLRLWREKRGEIKPEDLSGNLIVQLGVATEDLNRRWYEANTGQVITDIQKQVRHPALGWMRATLDGRVQGSDAVFEAKFMLPWSFSEETAAGSCSTTCGWWQPELRFFRSLRAAASGLRSQPTPIRSTSISSLQLSGNSGVVSRAASPLACLALSRQSPGLRPFGS